MTSLTDRWEAPGHVFSELKLPKGLYDRLLSDFPILRRDASLRRLLGVVLFSGYREPDGGRVLVFHELVAWCCRQDPFARHFRSGDLLRRFSAEVYPLDDLGWRYAQGLARTVNVPEQDPDYQALLFSEDEMVSLSTGNRWNDRYDRHNRESRLQAAGAVRVGSATHPAVSALEYLNGLSTRFFTVDADRLLAAGMLLEAQTDGGHYRHNVRLLGLLGSQPTSSPLYRPSRPGRTVRVFSDHPLLQLSAAYRSVLFPHWAELDLVHAQLSVISSLWGLEGLRKDLDEGMPVWTTLMAFLGLPEASKGNLKRSLYGLCYGMAPEKLWTGYGYLDKATGEKLLNHPWIGMLLEGRQRMLKTLIRAGGGTDVFGTWLPCDRKTASSVLAQLSQAMELKLMLPTFELAAADPYQRHVSVTLFQHDGFSLTVSHRDADRVPVIQAAFVAELRQRMLAAGAALGVRVRLA